MATSTTSNRRRGQQQSWIIDEPQSLLKNGGSKSSTSTRGKGSGGKSGPIIYETGTNGCLICKNDTDHDRLLICEFCNAEYHIYCLDPPLEAVPDGDFFCDRCKMFREGGEAKDDGLNELVEALPPSFTSRFGEICWAAGGNGFGWWPSVVYDPRLTVGIARSLARKHLGKRHLVYFFECLDAPFSVLPSAKLTSWEDGLQEEYDLGKAAKAIGKARARMFERALQIAKLEVEKPLDLRMDWNHKEELLLKQVSSIPPKAKRTKKNKSEARGIDGEKDGQEKECQPNTVAHRSSSVSDESDTIIFDRAESLVSSLNLSLSDLRLLSNYYNTIQTKNPPQKRTRRSNLEAVLKALPSTTNEVAEIEQPDEFLYCTILRKALDGSIHDNIGFVRMDRGRIATFAEARKQIMDGLEGSSLPSTWKFFVPRLGPVSSMQERKLVMLEVLCPTTSVTQLGHGSALSPLEVLIQDVSNSS